MQYPNEDSVVWRFATKNFEVVCHIYPCTDDPRDSFDCSGDVEAIADGRCLWFDTIVSVWQGETYLGHDALGGCAYACVEDFIAGHRDADPNQRNTLALKAQNKAVCRYFPDMVREAVKDARRNAQTLRTVVGKLKAA